VLTAQLALVTAETNWVQAVYDSIVADLRLKLATGDPLPKNHLRAGIDRACGVQ
jgi:outer membrane protein TolC